METTEQKKERLKNKGWFHVDEYLPPSDGIYLCSNDPDSKFSSMLSTMLYDGYGFKYEDVYRPVLYWTFYKEI